MRSYKMTTTERILSDILYVGKNHMGDIAAAIATVGILILAPIIMALGR